MTDFDKQHDEQVQADIERERQAVELFERFVDENADELKLIAHWGDGHCGYMLHVLQKRLGVEPS